MPTIARTKRLTLRTWKEGDEAAFRKHCNTKAVMRHLGGVQSTARLHEDVLWFGRCFNRYGHTLWVVERSDDGEFLGFAGLDMLLASSGEVPENLDGQVEVGWRLRQDAWGQGYATEAAAVSLEFGFRIRRIAHVISRAAADNAASIRIMEKLGMKPSSEFEPSEGEVLYEINRKTWYAHSDRYF